MISMNTNDTPASKADLSNLTTVDSHRVTLRSKITSAIANLQTALSGLEDAKSITRESLTETKQSLYVAHQLTSGMSEQLRPINKVVFSLKPGELPPGAK